MRRAVLWGVGLVATYAAVRYSPDLIRYMKMRSM